MADYLPPTEDLPIFDSSVFKHDTTALTVDEANKIFLRYPTAQGSETLQDTTIIGSLTIDNKHSNVGIYSGNNTGIGTSVFDIITTGQYNTAFGALSLYSVTSGTGNTGVGYTSLTFLTTGNKNTGIGLNALVQATTSNNNTAVGLGSLANLLTGNNNTAVGESALTSSSTGNANTALGRWAGFNCTGSNNIFIGHQSGINYGNCTNNIIIGNASGSSGTSSNTICIGSGITGINPKDIIFGSDAYNYVNFYDTGNGYGLTALTGSLGSTNTNLSFKSDSGNVNIQAVNTKIKGQLGIQSGKLLIDAGPDGSGSLQIQDNGTYPTITSGYGNFASVGGLPFYYSPSTSTWSQLITSGITGAALLSAGTALSPQTFTGYNKFNNLLLCDNGLTVTGTITGTLSGTATNATNVNVNNTSANATHYLTFVDTNTTGFKALQTTNSITLNPNTNTLTATSFVGDLTGNASNATAITLTSDNTSGNYYVPFSKTSAGTGKSLFIDDTTGPFTYNPSTSQVNCTNLVCTSINCGSITLSTGIQNPTGTGTATFSGSTLTISSTTGNSFRNFNIGFTGINNTVSTINISAMSVNSVMYVNIWNGAAGNLTISGTGLGANIKTTFSSGNFIVTGGVPVLMTINYLTFPTIGAQYVIDCKALG